MPAVVLHVAYAHKVNAKEREKRTLTTVRDHAWQAHKHRASGSKRYRTEWLCDCTRARQDLTTTI